MFSMYVVSISFITILWLPDVSSNSSSGTHRWIPRMFCFTMVFPESLPFPLFSCHSSANAPPILFDLTLQFLIHPWHLKLSEILADVEATLILWKCFHVWFELLKPLLDTHPGKFWFQTRCSTIGLICVSCSWLLRTLMIALEQYAVFKSFLEQIHGNSANILSKNIIIVL